MFDPDYSSIFCKFSVNGNAPNLSVTSLHHITVPSLAGNGVNADEKGSNESRYGGILIMREAPGQYQKPHPASLPHGDGLKRSGHLGFSCIIFRRLNYSSGREKGGGFCLH